MRLTIFLLIGCLFALSNAQEAQRFNWESKSLIILSEDHDFSFSIERTGKSTPVLTLELNGHNGDFFTIDGDTITLKQQDGTERSVSSFSDISSSSSGSGRLFLSIVPFIGLIMLFQLCSGNNVKITMCTVILLGILGFSYCQSPKRYEVVLYVPEGYEMDSIEVHGSGSVTISSSVQNLTIKSLIVDMCESGSVNIVSDDLSLTNFDICSMNTAFDAPLVDTTSGVLRGMFSNINISTSFRGTLRITGDIDITGGDNFCSFDESDGLAVVKCGDDNNASVIEIDSADIHISLPLDACGGCTGRTICQSGSCVDACPNIECGVSSLDSRISCGSCSGSTFCNTQGICQDACENFVECGASPMNTDISCGECSGDGECLDGACVSSCQTCGGSCDVEDCPSGQTCERAFHPQEYVCAAPCDGKQCGEPGFDGSICEESCGDGPGEVHIPNSQNSVQNPCTGGVFFLFGNMHTLGCNGFKNDTLVLWFVEGDSPLEISFTHVDVRNQALAKDAIYVFDGPDFDSRIIAQIREPITAPIITTSGKAIIAFETDFRGNELESDLGFIAQISAYDPPVQSPCSLNDFVLQSVSPTGKLETIGCDGYTNNARVTWLIEGSERVRIRFTSFDTETNLDTVSVYDGRDSSATLMAEYSGSSIPASLETSGEMFIVFDANGSVNNSGFVGEIIPLLEPIQSPCLRGDTDIFLFGNTQTIGCDSFGYYSLVTWLIEGTTQLEISFSNFDIGFYHFVYIYDGVDSSATRLAKYRGAENAQNPIIPPPVSTSGTNMYVVFDSDGWNPLSGFIANISAA